MNRFTSPKPFLDTAMAAFPPICRAEAIESVRQLASVVDDTYRKRSICLEVDGRSIYIPERLHFRCGTEIFAEPNPLPLPARCLLTRSTDGHLRQQAVRSIIEFHETWAIPFIVILLGDYVVEIVMEILPALPNFDRFAYSDFVRQNRPALRGLRSKATSYWNAYYRETYPKAGSYPGLAALYQLESWAA